MFHASTNNKQIQTIRTIHFLPLLVKSLPKTFTPPCLARVWGAEIPQRLPWSSGHWSTALGQEHSLAQQDGSQAGPTVLLETAACTRGFVATRGSFKGRAQQEAVQAEAGCPGMHRHVRCWKHKISFVGWNTSFTTSSRDGFYAQSKI